MASLLFYVSTSFWLLYTYTFVDMDLLSISCYNGITYLFLYFMLITEFSLGCTSLLLTITNSCALVVGG